MTRILIIKLGAVGDIIMALPAIRRIRVAHPGAETTILTSRPFKALFEACPDIDRVDASGRDGRRFESLHLAKGILSGGYDMVYDLQASAGTRRLHLAMRLLSAPTAIGRPFFAPPNVPADRVKALRAAFDATMKLPAFLEDAKKLNLDINPVSGEELQKIVADIIDAPKPVKDRLAAVLALIDREKSK